MGDKDEDSVTNGEAEFLAEYSEEDFTKESESTEMMENEQASGDVDVRPKQQEKAKEKTKEKTKKKGIFVSYLVELFV